MTEKLVESMKLVDFSDMEVPLIVVYDHPADYPNAYIARVWEMKGNLPTNTFIERGTLQEIREDIRSAGFMHYISRTAEDDPVIVEMWMERRPVQSMDIVSGLYKLTMMKVDEIG